MDARRTNAFRDAKVMLIYADHVERNLFRLLVEENFPGCCILEVTLARDAPSAAGEVSPHVVLLDASIGEPGCVELIKRIRRRAPAAEVVVTTLQPGVVDLDMAVAAQRAGAADFLTKSTLPRRLVPTLRDLIGMCFVMA